MATGACLWHVDMVFRFARRGCSIVAALACALHRSVFNTNINEFRRYVTIITGIRGRDMPWRLGPGAATIVARHTGLGDRTVVNLGGCKIGIVVTV